MSCLDRSLCLNKSTGEFIAYSGTPSNVFCGSAFCDRAKILDVYDKRVNEYKTGYKPYEELRGSIRYYMNESDNNVLKTPNFVNSAFVHSSVYKDPLDTCLNVFTRFPIDETHKCLDRAKLTFIEDTSENREQLMNAQMSKMNQQTFLWKSTF
jgi:hypothetical protein